jgi:hypothetical protein
LEDVALEGQEVDEFAVLFVPFAPARLLATLVVARRRAAWPPWLRSRSVGVCDLGDALGLRGSCAGLVLVATLTYIACRLTVVSQAFKQ